MALQILGTASLIALIVFICWLIKIVIAALTFDNDRCNDCPLKQKCFGAVAVGLPPLCQKP